MVKPDDGLTQPTRIYSSIGASLRALCWYCSRLIADGSGVVDLVGPATGQMAHDACNRDALESGAYQ